MLASSHSLHQDLNEELDEVFKARQKQGSYKSIPKEKRMILKREFDRVGNNDNNFFFIYL